MEIDSNGVRFHYQKQGSGKYTLLFIHGSFIDSSYWEEQVKFFSKDYTTISVDLPGHGRSANISKHYTFQNVAESLATFITSLRLDNIILVGHSMGADIALEIAVRYSSGIIGFVGVDYFKMAGTPFPKEMEEEIHKILKGLETNFAETNEQYVKKVLVTEATDQAIVDRIVNAYKNADPSIAIPLIKNTFTNPLRQRELLQDLEFRLHLINSDYMPIQEDPLKQYCQSGFEVREIHGTSHYPMLEKSEEFNHILATIIDKIIMENVSKVKLQQEASK